MWLFALHWIRSRSRRACSSEIEAHYWAPSGKECKGQFVGLYSLKRSGGDTMKRQFVFAVFALGIFLSSCAHKDQVSTENAPHITVIMRDGSRVGGTVVENSPTKITVAGDDGVTRTIPVTQVSSIEYGGAPFSSETATSNEVPARQQAVSPNPARKTADRQISSIPTPMTQSRTRTQPDGETESHSHPAESAITTKTYELPVGTTVSVRTEETIDSGKAVEGQTFAGEVTDDVLDADGAAVIPRGANAKLVIKSASKGGKFRGASDLVVDLQEVAIEGRQYQLSTSDIVKQGKSGVGANKRTAVYTGGGAALGAIIGAIAGGGKGAAIGAGAGGGGGALAQILTQGGSIRIPVETVLKFQLDKPLHATAAR